MYRGKEFLRKFTEMEFNNWVEKNEMILDEALERQQILETIINNSPVMAFLWSPEGDWPAKYVSENVTQLEYSAEDFLAGRIMYANIIHSEDIDRVRENSQDAAKPEKTVLCIDTESSQGKEKSAGLKKKPLSSGTKRET